VNIPLTCKVLCKLADERLTKKQKIILLKINGEKTLTKLVWELSKEIKCSKSGLWKNVNSLIRAGLLTQTVRVPARLTREGLIVKKYLEVKNNAKKCRELTNPLLPRARLLG